MELAIYILAEGNSSRMGEDKGLVKINGKEMVLHCIENLKPISKNITIITSNLEYEKFGFRLISDEIKNQGPAGGIITALMDCNDDGILIAACDMPLIHAGMIQQLLDTNEQYSIRCFADDKFYPFPGLYAKAILQPWIEKVSEGNYKMQSLIKQFAYKALPIEQTELFLNVNKPEDITFIEQLLE